MFLCVCFVLCMCLCTTPLWRSSTRSRVCSLLSRGFDCHGQSRGHGPLRNFIISRLLPWLVTTITAKMHGFKRFSVPARSCVENNPSPWLQRPDRVLVLEIILTSETVRDKYDKVFTSRQVRSQSS